MVNSSSWEERRRRAQIFGDDLPDVTADETGANNGDRDHSGGSSSSDDWFLSNKPPHHE